MGDNAKTPVGADPKNRAAGPPEKYERALRHLANRCPWVPPRDGPPWRAIEVWLIRWRVVPPKERPDLAFPSQLAEALGVDGERDLYPIFNRDDINLAVRDGIGAYVSMAESELVQLALDRARQNGPHNWHHLRTALMMDPINRIRVQRNAVDGEETAAAKGRREARNGKRVDQAEAGDPLAEREAMLAQQRERMARGEAP